VTLACSNSVVWLRRRTKQETLRCFAGRRASASLNTIPSPRLLAMSRASASRRFSATPAQIVAAETQKVEGHECGHEPASIGQGGVEVAAPVVLEDDRLAADQHLVRIEAVNRLRDPGKAIREIGAAAAPDLDALAQLPGKDAEAVVFYFMQPAWSGWRIGDERPLARADEARSVLILSNSPRRRRRNGLLL
jgi:hypothetical protein